MHIPQQPINSLYMDALMYIIVNYLFNLVSKKIEQRMIIVTNLNFTIGNERIKTNLLRNVYNIIKNPYNIDKTLYNVFKMTLNVTKCR